MKVRIFSIARLLLSVLCAVFGIVPAGEAADFPVSALVVPSVPPDGDIVDDFNDMNDLNYWQGANGAMEEAVGDGSITRSFVTAGAFAGASLKVDYDLTQTSTWNGFFLNLNDSSLVTKNLSAYKQLSFQVKGGVGGVEHLKIGLENTSAESTNRSRVALYVNDYLDGGITNSWQKVTIPLAAFSGLNSFSTAKTLTFVFEKSYAAPSLNPGLAQIGTVYIDDVRFSTVEPAEIRVDHFGDNAGRNALGGNWGSMPAVAPVLAYVSVADATAKTLQSTYNVQTADWQGHFCLFGGGNSGDVAYPVNVSSYRYLKFKIRAASSTQNPKTLKLEIQHGTQQTDLIITGITTTFQEMVIDMNATPINKTAVKQINIVYEKSRIDAALGDRQGNVYFDDIRFGN